MYIDHFHNLAVGAGFYGDVIRVVGTFMKSSNIHSGWALDGWARCLTSLSYIRWQRWDERWQHYHIKISVAERFRCIGSFLGSAGRRVLVTPPSSQDPGSRRQRCTGSFLGSARRRVLVFCGEIKRRGAEMNRNRNIDYLQPCYGIWLLLRRWYSSLQRTRWSRGEVKRKEGWGEWRGGREAAER